MANGYKIIVLPSRLSLINSVANAEFLFFRNCRICEINKFTNCEVCMAAVSYSSASEGWRYDDLVTRTLIFDL